MSNGSLDFTHLKDREILLLLVQRTDGWAGVPKRVAALERKWAWLAGIGSAITAALGFLEVRRHG